MLQVAGENILTELRSGADSVQEKLVALLEGVKDPLSSWLDSKVL